jgi:hypothetical protein
MPGGYRHMYYLTGLPGWMRFGYSPGWGGMPPGATYLMTSQWPTPQAQAYWESMQSGNMPYPFYGAGMAPFAWPMVSRDQELTFLKNQAQFLKQQLEQIDARISELEKEGS